MRRPITILLFIGLLSLIRGLLAHVTEVDNASLQALIDQGCASSGHTPPGRVATNRNYKG